MKWHHLPNWDDLFLKNKKRHWPIRKNSSPTAIFTLLSPVSLSLSLLNSLSLYNYIHMLLCTWFLACCFGNGSATRAITLTKPLSFPNSLHLQTTPPKMRQKSELVTTTKLLKYVLIGLIVFLGLICLYSGSSVAPGLRKPGDAVDDGADPVISRFVTRHDLDDLFDDQEHNPEVPKSIPVCNE